MNIGYVITCRVSEIQIGTIPYWVGDNEEDAFRALCSAPDYFYPQLYRGYSVADEHYVEFWNKDISNWTRVNYEF